jgi:hypothetical protein
MEVRIKNKSYTVRKTFRAVMIFEKLTGKPFAVSTTTDMLLLFYSCYMASEEAEPLEFESFVAILDDDPSLLADFTEMLRVEYAIREQFPAEKAVKGKSVKKKA